MSLKDVLKAVGGDPNTLPDNLKSTLYEEIIKKLGGSVDDLPDRLETTYLKRIVECLGGGSNTVTFTIDGCWGGIREYTVAEGTTWAEWAKTTYDAEAEDIEWSDMNGLIFNNFEGGLIADPNGNPVDSYTVIIAGKYYRGD
jgi:hypothetical protein